MTVFAGTFVFEGFGEAAGGGGDEGGSRGAGLLLLVLLPGKFCDSRGGSCGGLGVEFLVYLLNARLHTLEGFEDLGSLVDVAFVKTLFEYIAGRPEHTEGGVAAFVGGIHRADSVVGFLYAPLPAEIENVFDGHGCNG